MSENETKSRLIECPACGQNDVNHIPIWEKPPSWKRSPDWMGCRVCYSMLPYEEWV